MAPENKAKPRKGKDRLATTILFKRYVSLRECMFSTPETMENESFQLILAEPKW